MSNQPGMAEQHSIITLWKRGCSHRRIARTLVIHGETVSGYVRLAEEAAVNATGPPGISLPAGSESHGESKPAISIAGSSGRQSQCEPYRNVIEAYLAQGLTAKRIWQDLRDDQGLAGGYLSVKRFVRKLRSRTPLPLRRMDALPVRKPRSTSVPGAWVVQANGTR